MNKTEYRAYIESAEWQQTRKAHLEKKDYCNRCYLPRWLAVIAYDQDLHVHHRDYSSTPELESLCKRCHEVETFGSSSLHKPQNFECAICGCLAYFDRYNSEVCQLCDIAISKDYSFVQGVEHGKRKNV